MSLLRSFDEATVLLLFWFNSFGDFKCAFQFACRLNMRPSNKSTLLTHSSRNGWISTKPSMYVERVRCYLHLTQPAAAELRDFAVYSSSFCRLSRFLLWYRSRRASSSQPAQRSHRRCAHATLGSVNNPPNNGHRLDRHHQPTMMIEIDESGCSASECFFFPSDFASGEDLKNTCRSDTVVAATTPSTKTV